MKQRGKERIFFGENTHTYLRISWNLGDEIFPKGVGVVTLQNFDLVFIKIFIWFKGGYLNFSFWGTLLLKIFYDKPLKGPSQPWSLVLRVFQNFVGSTQLFSFGKSFEILSFNDFGSILPDYKILCHDLGWKFYSTTPSVHFWSCQIINPSRCNPFLIFILFILSSKLFLSFILDLGDLQRNHQIPFEFWFQTNSSN